MMFFAIITLLTALSMATVAAWFAIAGIMAVFAGAPIPALIMGVVVELGKIIGVSWIYRNWKERTSIKYTMFPPVIVAMLLTSMGIFGFLSKAHLEQSAPVGNNTAQIERLDQRIAREQAKIDDAETVKGQLDEQVNTLIEYSKISGPDGSRAVRAGQEEQRDALAATIDESENNISKFSDEKFTLSSELRELELEVGPVKYIAAVIYEDPETNLEEAVRIVIIAFIFVFDPMAILLLMAANFSFIQIKGESLPGLRRDEESFIVTASSVDVNGEDLIDLIDDDPEEVVPEPNKPIVKQPDRSWLNDIPKDDAKVDNQTMISTIQKLRKRKRTNDEQVLLERFKRLASSRNIPWDIAKRAGVSTQNDILKR